MSIITNDTLFYFLALTHKLYTSLCFENVLPWGSSYCCHETTVIMLSLTITMCLTCQPFSAGASRTKSGLQTPADVQQAKDLYKTTGHYCDRVRVTSAGCFIWGVCTAGFSTCRSLRQGYLFWAVNGIGLSFVIPTGQSLIADYYQVRLACCCMHAFL